MITGPTFPLVENVKDPLLTRVYSELILCYTERNFLTLAVSTRTILHTSVTRLC